ncbi:MAG: polyprenyl synthetase family protein [Pseudomonadota bacterium]
MTFEDIQTLVADELKQVDALIHQHLYSSVSMAEEIAEYIVYSGGKRIRPILLLLSAKACGYTGDKHIVLAAIIELLHTATLLHDDVIDQSDLRRGKQTANALWGNQASVLVGDLLHARSFQMIAGLDNDEVTQRLAAATGVIVEGELLQLNHCHNPKTDEDTYLKIIHNKTGKLFEIATEIGAILCDTGDDIKTALATYGRNVGTAFQLIDDVLDYTGNSEEIGKNIGDDLVEGKPTLPLIYVMQHGNNKQKAIVCQALLNSQKTDLDTIKTAMIETGAIDYTRNYALNFIEQATKGLEALPQSTARDALAVIANFAIERQS